jgi:putative PIN family toxin of toxin-antitoxin system
LVPKVKLRRVVLDTNLLVRMIISPSGATGRIRAVWRARAFHHVTSEPLLDELVKVLRSPRLQGYAPLSDAILERLVAIVRRASFVVPGHYTGIDKVPTDLKDNIVVACALEAEADFIVTDDRRDLLPLKVIRCAGYRPVQIVSPMAFLRLLTQLTTPPSPDRP